jgi:hypothetical protein
MPFVDDNATFSTVPLIELDGMSLPANAYHHQDVSGAIERE